MNNFGKKRRTTSCHNIFRGEQDAVKKYNNLIVARWLNILCKRGGVTIRRIAILWYCYQRNVNVTHAVAYLHFHLPEFIDPDNWPSNSQYLNTVDFSVWGALQQNLYR